MTDRENLAFFMFKRIPFSVHHAWIPLTINCGRLLLKVPSMYARMSSAYLIKLISLGK